MKLFVGLFKKHDITILLIVLVLSLSALSWHNYYSQKNLLLEQMKSDSGDIVSSISAAIKKFYDIKETINIQQLVSQISLDLEIFEFRYLDSSGVIRNSMFEQEIGKISRSQSFVMTMQGDMPLGEFFFEEHDYVPVMAIYYPLYRNNDLIGIIDFSIDISEYSVVSEVNKDFALTRRQVDILNLLKAIEGSIYNTISIFESINLHDFLFNYVETAENILEISVIDDRGRVIVSSDPNMQGRIFDKLALQDSELIEVGDDMIYRIVTDQIEFSKIANGHLSLLVDATVFAKNKKALKRNSIINNIITMLFALIMATIIYRSAIQRSKNEQEKLRLLVQERTKEIELMSKIDSLTNLWNRRYLEEMLEIEFKRARRYKSQIYILLIDLDHFKKINDTYGHLAGDEVLKEVSMRIKSSLRETDFIGRYGGEELVVILPQTPEDEVSKIAQKIVDFIASKPVRFNDSLIHVTASIGVSRLRSTHTSYHDIFQEADEALYVSKREGRNRVTYYSILPVK